MTEVHALFIGLGFCEPFAALLPIIYCATHSAIAHEKQKSQHLICIPTIIDGQLLGNYFCCRPEVI